MGGQKTVGTIHSEAFSLVTKNYVVFLVIALVMWAVGIVLESVSSIITAPLGMLGGLLGLPIGLLSESGGRWSDIPVILGTLSFSFIGILASVAVGVGVSIFQSAAEIGGKNATLELLAGRKPAFDSVWKDFWRNWKRYLGITAWMTLWTFLWSLLLFVPGYIKALSYRFAPYLMIQYPDMTIREALKKSMEITEGYKGRLFGLDLILFGYGLAMVILCCFVIPLLGFLLWLPPMTFAMVTIAYADIKQAAIGKGLLPPDPLPPADGAVLTVEQAS